MGRRGGCGDELACRLCTARVVNSRRQRSLLFRACLGTSVHDKPPPLPPPPPSRLRPPCPGLLIWGSSIGAVVTAA